jgi:hypothetical protein
MINYVYIDTAAAAAHRWELHKTDHVLLVAENSLIMTEPDWLALCKEAGGEEKLMAEMGVKWAKEGEDAINEN